MFRPSLQPLYTARCQPSASHHRPTSTQNHSEQRHPESSPGSRWTYDFAVRYAERGYSVIPLVPNSKLPAIAWKPYQSQRPCEADLRNWFSHDELNIGIVTGRISSLVVIDADTAEEAAWCRATFPPTPLVVSTGRGGSHFYYQHPKDSAIGNRARVFERAIDVRGDGGFVCAPPSVHTHITELFRNGATVPVAKSQARHTDIKMTMKYVHTDLAEQAAAVERLHVPAVAPSSPDESGQYASQQSRRPSRQEKSQPDTARHNEKKNEADVNSNETDTSNNAWHKQTRGDANWHHPVKSGGGGNRRNVSVFRSDYSFST